MSGYIYDADNLLTEMNQEVKNSRWLCTHGTFDDVLPYTTSKAQINTLKNAGFDITFKSYDKSHNIDEEELNMIKKWLK